MKRFDSTQHLIKHLKDARRCIDHMIFYLQEHKDLDVLEDDTDNERLSFYNDARFIANLMMTIQREVEVIDCEYDAFMCDKVNHDYRQTIIQKYGVDPDDAPPF